MWVSSKQNTVSISAFQPGDFLQPSIWHLKVTFIWGNIGIFGKLLKYLFSLIREYFRDIIYVTASCQVGKFSVKLTLLDSPPWGATILIFFFFLWLNVYKFWGEVIEKWFVNTNMRAKGIQDGMPKTGQPTVFRLQWNSMAGHPGYEFDSPTLNKVLFQIKRLCNNHLLNKCSTWYLSLFWNCIGSYEHQS